MEQYTKEQRIFIVKTYYKCGENYPATVQKVGATLGSQNVPHLTTILSFIKQFEETGAITDEVIYNGRVAKDLETSIQIKQEPNSTDHGIYKIISEKNSPTTFYECVICQIQFKSKVNFRRHLATHKEQPQYACEVCQKTFTAKKYVQNHMRKWHANFVEDEMTLRNECPKCYLTLNSKVNLQKHLLAHREAKPFPCDECPKTFSSKKTLASHKKRCHQSSKYLQDNEGVASLEQVNINDDSGSTDVGIKQEKEYSEGEDMSEEIDQKPNIEEITFDYHLSEIKTEPEDEKEAADAANNRMEFEAETGNIEFVRVKYEITEEAAEESSSLTVNNSNFESVSSPPEKKRKLDVTNNPCWQCGNCNKIFPHMRALQKHQLVHKVYSCISCSKEFSTRIELSQHIINRHHGDEEYSTDYDEEEETRCYQCHTCHEKFTKEEDLTMHIKIRHIDIFKREKLTCNICKKAFPNETETKKHLRTHMQKLSCPYCLKPYGNRKSYLIKHMENCSSKPSSDVINITEH